MKGSKGPVQTDQVIWVFTLAYRWSFNTRPHSELCGDEQFHANIKKVREVRKGLPKDTLWMNDRDGCKAPACLLHTDTADRQTDKQFIRFSAWRLCQRILHWLNLKTSSYFLYRSLWKFISTASLSCFTLFFSPESPVIPQSTCKTWGLGFVTVEERR